MLSETYFGYGQFGFSWGDHICAIFDSPRQQMEIMVPFIAAGLRSSQRCTWIAPPAAANDFRKSLTDLGADLPTLEGSGQLVMISDVDFYLHEGLFEPSRTMDLVVVLLDDGRTHGYDAMRVAADVSWLRNTPVDPDLWESYESQVTQQVRGLPLVQVCQYHRRQVSADMIVTALRTHPIVILGDAIHRNPFYVTSGDDVPSQEII